jgi:hypothetical protein
MKNTLYNLLESNTIVIPLIQRDYAQGRTSEVDLRNDFLKKIKEILNSDDLTINLDFIYGYTEQRADNLIFVPLDGQQRLTTLWLIHWYFALKEDIILIEKENITSILKKFTYETRISSKRFCESLVMNPISESNKLELFSSKIKNSPWFMASWGNDPTIISMLNMLNSIIDVLGDCKDVWKKLVFDKKITFDYIDIKSEEFKLTDELYIKMNSRGKPLTSFENFKAQFSDLLSSKQTDFKNTTIQYKDILDKNTEVTFQQYFAFKIDSVWMDLFWKYRLKTNISIDNCILNFIYYIAEVLYYKNNSDVTIATFVRNFENLRKVFSIKENTLFLFNALDVLSEIQNIDLFFSGIFNVDNVNENGIALFEDGTTDLFQRALTDTNFDVKHKTLLYALLVYCIQTNTTVSSLRLKYYIRIIRNLLLAVRQPNAIKRIEYASNLRFPNINDYSKFIDGFVNLLANNPDKDVYSILSECNLNGFTEGIINSEKAKAETLIKDSTLTKYIFDLEDHPEIQGNISCFNLDLENPIGRVKAFKEIWNPGIESSLIIRAFLTQGDYSVITHTNLALGEIWYFGNNKSWNKILTTSNKDEIPKVSNSLYEFLISFLNSKGENTENKLNDLIDNYLNNLSLDSPRNWKYYFIKYKNMTSTAINRFNLFTWKDDKGFDINNLGNSGVSPLLSYHINPYIYTLNMELAPNDEIKLNWGRYSSEISNLSIKDKLSIFSSSEGWQIYLKNNFTISDTLLSKYVIEDKSGFFILKDNDQKDRIEIASEFIKELLTEV